MKTTSFIENLRNILSKRMQCSVITIIALVGVFAAKGQGIIGFDNVHLPFGGTNYYELGMWFRVIIPTRGTGSPGYDGMVVEPASGYSNLPTNSTPYMVFFQQNSPDDYVAFSLTNGYSFGLTSVQLADPNSPSAALVPRS